MAPTSEFNPTFDIPKDLPGALPVLPLRQGFLLPGVVSPFTIGRQKSLLALDQAEDGWFIIALQRESITDPEPSDLLPIGVLARVVQPLQENEKMKAVAIQGIARVRLESFTATVPYFRAEYHLLDQQWPEGANAEGIHRALVDAVTQLVDEMEVNTPVRRMVERIEDPALLADIIAAMVESRMSFKRDILLTTDPLRRSEKVLEHLARVKEVVKAQRSIEERVKSEVKDTEKEIILRRQLKAIQEELGENDEANEIQRLREKLEGLPLPEDARSAVNRELSRLERMQSAGPERNVAFDWLQWISDLPWDKTSAHDTDLDELEKTLDNTHFGLSDVKKQVIEHLAVRKLSGKGRADVLLLVGPPGVGKTSIATAISEATERKLVRVALGGMRDEAELRGHRRTYVGARPGRLVEGLRRAGTADPVVLLDEIDKLGRGYQGDPASALLEILDPEQNHAFVDHYLEVPFDLSKVLFIATANDLSTVPPPLRDRMEVIEIEGYTKLEKLEIAKDYVLSKLATNAGVALDDVVLSDDILQEAIDGWTREAGVRQLQRVLGKVFRAAAVKKAKDQLEAPLVVESERLEDYLGRRKFYKEEHEAVEQAGIATGLAWTPMGGDVLYVEASKTPGKGRLVLTGQLGDVMKESAQAALTYVRGIGDRIGVNPDAFEKSDVHLHVPAGATPKDGPSAGVTMFSALASLMTGRPVATNLAMTGEVTLRGRVLPVGGIKSKVLAAHARGIRKVVIPKRNEPDLADLPDSVKDEVEFVLASHLDQVLDAALGVPEA